MGEHSNPPTSKKGMNRGAFRVLHGEVATPLTGFGDKDTAERGDRLFTAQWETSISICMIKTQCGAQGKLQGTGELAGTATGLGWPGNCLALKCLQNLLIKGQAHRKASRVMFRNWNMDCFKSSC